MVLEAILRQGFRLTREKLPIRPEIECAHYGRLRMLKRIKEGISNCYQVWEALRDEENFILQEPTQMLIQSMLHLEDSPVTAEIERQIAEERDRCHICRFRNLTKRPGTLTQGHGLRSNAKVTSAVAESSDGEQDNDKDEEEEEGNVDANVDAKVPAHIRSNPHMKNARLRIGAPARGPPDRKHTIPLAPQAFVHLPVSRFDDFDQWYNGPTLEDLRNLERPGGIDYIYLENYSRPTVYSSFEVYKDYGYRLMRDFALMFNTDTPTAAAEHLLPLPHVSVQGERYESTARTLSPKDLENLFSSQTPVGSERDVEMECEEESINSPVVDTLFVGGYDPNNDPTDSIRMSMSQMLSDAGPRGSITAMNMFVGGTNKDGKTIILDQTADIRYLDPDSFELSVDIDSVIWTTHHLKTKGEILLHVLPYLSSRAPIYKSNHAYIDLLMPQSLADKDKGGRTEWFTTQVSLSVIPHIPFAKIPCGATTFNIYVFFPRMMHRDPVTGRRKTLIPREIQVLWLTMVVYPAMKACEDKTMEPYNSYTLDEWVWKTDFDNRMNNLTRTVPIKEGFLDKLQDIMAHTVESEAELAMLGSFFFLLDGRGMKHTTSTNVKAERDPYLELTDRFPVLDWEHMMLRRNGQLLMDLGMGFHPCSPHGEPLVALWHLESLDKSYSMAGLNQGTTHHLNTFESYGGRQAEMGMLRQRIVQLSFRSSYGLYYQPVRRGRGGDVKFCKEVDAYDANHSFSDSISSYIKVFKGSVSKSFGGRDEMRGSGVAIKEVLQEAPRRVGRCLLWNLKNVPAYLKFARWRPT